MCTRKILLNCCPPAYPDSPLASLSVLKSFLTVHDYQVNIKYWNIELYSIIQDFFPWEKIEGTTRFLLPFLYMLHLVCDLTIASDNAIFGQTGPKVGSFDAGFGSSYLARIVGQKKAREIWFLCRQYSAKEAEEMGMVNKVVPIERLEDECVEWAEIMMERSPLALRMIKAGLNAELDGQAGIQELAGDCTMLYYFLDEAQEGGKAFLEKRKPDFKKYPKLP